ncbi:hypothetical protein C7D71_31100, partial [Klebsiella pneumoniae]
ERLSLNVTRSAPASAHRTKNRSVSASRAVRKILLQLLEREREAIVERDEVGARKRASHEESERLSQPGGSEDP